MILPMVPYRHSEEHTPCFLHPSMFSVATNVKLHVNDAYISSLSISHSQTVFLKGRAWHVETISSLTPHPPLGFLVSTQLFIHSSNV